MKITKQKLNQIIKEELAAALFEDAMLDMNAVKKAFKDQLRFSQGAMQGHGGGLSDVSWEDVQDLALRHTFKELNIDPKTNDANMIANILKAEAGPDPYSDLARR